MKVFYIYIDKFKKNFSKEALIDCTDIKLKTEKRFYEYTAGRFLVTNIAKRIYNCNDTKIILTPDGKPFFKNWDICFSLSHSKNIVIACFDKDPCGIDIEYMKRRNLKELSSYYKKDFNTTEDFYKFWTLNEAIFKIGSNYKDSFSLILDNQYFVNIVSLNRIKKPIISEEFII